MSRPVRIEFPGANYHVTSKGKIGQTVFTDSEDRGVFLNILENVVGRFGWLLHSYVLMGDHYHLVLEVPEANLSKGMRQLNGVYTQHVNRRHSLEGPIFNGRFKSVLFEKKSYLLPVCRHVVTNPARVALQSHLSHSNPSHSNPSHSKSSLSNPSFSKISLSERARMLKVQLKNVPVQTDLLMDGDAHIGALDDVINSSPNNSTNYATYRWSSYRATAGQVRSPVFLNTSEILANFGKDDEKGCQQKYRNYVKEGLDAESPLTNKKCQVLLGSNKFLNEMQPILQGERLAKRGPRAAVKRRSLASIFRRVDEKTRMERNELIRKAHVQYGYTLMEIGEQLGLHYTTVSKVVNA